MLALKIDQIAFTAHVDSDHFDIRKELDLDDDALWESTDLVRARGVLFGEEVENLAKLSFCYSYGMEVEILQYLEGANYCEHIPSGRQCHVGAHAVSPYAAEDIKLNAPIVQQVVTQHHTNPIVNAANRRYKYTIYDTVRLLGTHFKVIERLDVSDADRHLEDVLRTAR